MNVRDRRLATGHRLDDVRGVLATWGFLDAEMAIEELVAQSAAHKLAVLARAITSAYFFFAGLPSAKFTSLLMAMAPPRSEDGDVPECRRRAAPPPAPRPACYVSSHHCAGWLDRLPSRRA